METLIINLIQINEIKMKKNGPRYLKMMKKIKSRNNILTNNRRMKLDLI